MNRSTRQDLVQPSLLDRLTDHAPQQSRDAQEERAFSLQRLRQAVLRDLTWLLNAGNLAAAVDLRPYPQVAASTLNYGIATPHGRNRDGLDIDLLRQQMLLSLRRFEPRLLPSSLQVKGVDALQAGALIFRIEATLWAEPAPLRLVLRAELDREVAAIRVVEEQGREAA